VIRPEGSSSSALLQQHGTPELAQAVERGEIAILGYSLIDFW
jgi:hypothetical protein